MLIILAIGGFIFGAIVYLYLLSLFRDISSKNKEKNTIDGDLITGKRESRVAAAGKDNGEKKFPRPRYCPVCKSILSEWDSLFAEMYHNKENPEKVKVFIHGCRHCYRPSGIKSEGSVDINKFKDKKNTVTEKRRGSLESAYRRRKMS